MTSPLKTNTVRVDPICIEDAVDIDSFVYDQLVPIFFINPSENLVLDLKSIVTRPVQIYSTYQEVENVLTENSVIFLERMPLLVLFNDDDISPYSLTDIMGLRTVIPQFGIIEIENGIVCSSIIIHNPATEFSREYFEDTFNLCLDLISSSLEAANLISQIALAGVPSTDSLNSLLSTSSPVSPHSPHTMTNQLSVIQSSGFFERDSDADFEVPTEDVTTPTSGKSLRLSRSFVHKRRQQYHEGSVSDLFAKHDIDAVHKTMHTIQQSLLTLVDSIDHNPDLGRDVIAKSISDVASYYNVMNSYDATLQHFPPDLKRFLSTQLNTAGPSIDNYSLHPPTQGNRRLSFMKKTYYIDSAAKIVPNSHSNIGIVEIEGEGAVIITESYRPPLKPFGGRFYTSATAMISPSSPIDDFVCLNTLRGVMPSIDLTFNVLTLELDVITAHIDSVMKYFNFYDILVVNRKRFFSFIRILQYYYYNNSFHNFVHCLDVFFTLYQLIRIGNLSENFLTIELFSLFIAALAHDIRHPGVSSNFLHKIQHEFTIKFNDNSPLENLHLKTLFYILKVPILNFLEGMSYRNYNIFRKFIIRCVLGTDMSSHRTLVNDFNLLSPNFNKFESSHRIKLAVILLKCADVGNVAKPFDIHRDWALRLREEFFFQGDQERAYDIPISDYFDRLTDDTTERLALLEIGFLEFICLPLFKSLTAFCMDLHEFEDHVAENLHLWRDIQFNPTARHSPSNSSAPSPLHSPSMPIMTIPNTARRPISSPLAPTSPVEMSLPDLTLLDRMSIDDSPREFELQMNVDSFDEHDVLSISIE
ncbi:hypothetical protein PCE1_003334 [Barthelona sp. PCE]